MSILGLNFGSNKSKTNSSGTKTETGTQSGTSSTNSTTTGSQTQNTQNQSTGSSTTSQQGSTTQTGSSQQQQSSQLFSNDVLNSLNSLVTGMLGQGGSVDTSKSLDNFDAEAFINGITQAAAAKTQQGVDSSIGGIIDNVGGKNNSMAALLSNQVNADAAASLAGVTAQAQQTAAQIQQQNLAAQTAANAGNQGFLTNLIEAPKGGSATGTTTGATTGTEQTSQTGTTDTSESSTSSSQTSTIETLAQVLQQLLSSNSTTTANETSSTKGSQIGGSLTLGGSSGGGGGGLQLSDIFGG